MKFLSLALLSLTALVGAQSMSTVVDGLNALTKSFQSSDFNAGHVSSFSSQVDGLAAQIQDFTTSISPVGQKRGYPVARILSARTTFSDADAAQVVDALKSFASAEEDILSTITAEQDAISLAGQAQPMYDSLVKLQQANQALSTAMAATFPGIEEVEEVLEAVMGIVGNLVRALLLILNALEPLLGV